MDYEKKYNEALEKARIINSGKYVEIPAEDTVLEYIFPELKESEDEKILKAITQGIRDMADGHGWSDFGGFPIDDILAWLEKQGKRDARYENLEELLEADDIYQMAMNDAMVSEAKEKATKALSELCIGKLLGFEKKSGQKINDKVEPKFKVGEWLQYRNAKPFFVKEITKQGYVNGDSCLPFNWENEIHLWSIQDARDGDVLVASDDSVFIYGGSTEKDTKFYVALTKYGTFNLEGGNWEDKNYVYPATKSQRDTLFEKIKEAGYEWSNEHRKLIKIAQ